MEPPNWWVGMKQDTLQLMVYGNNLDDINVTSSESNLKILNVHSLENHSYLFVDIIVSKELKPGTYSLFFQKDGFKKDYNYSFNEREIKAEDHLGFSNQDVIYLIFADRFCDGNPANNTIGDSLDEFTSKDIDGRKGGDIEGIISKLDYIKELGATAIWVTPMLENNMWMSYHGYAATDLYKIDPRFGSNALYEELIEEAHSKGLKIILDHVSNHIGINHYWLKNPPSKNWFNGSPQNFIQASHDKIAFLDIHSDSNSVKRTQDGWFTNYMPDLNQRNPLLKKYLVQNTIWWIEYAGIDGIREDTYPYCDQKYLAEWTEAILNEYPDFNIVGEIWQGVPSVISGYQTKSPIRKINFDSNLPTATDFVFCDAVRSFLDGKEKLYIVYETIAQDYIYSNPDNLLVFMDNHDISRAAYIANGDLKKIEVALNLVLFTRGIPCIFYGTEIGLEGGPKDGELRHPFPGGFVGDSLDAFTESGRTKNQDEVYNYLHNLLSLRNKYPVLSKGSLRHIYPSENVYLLIKEYQDQEALIFINASDVDITVKPFQMQTFLPEAKALLNLKTNQLINFESVGSFIINKFSAEIFLAKK
ncbi:MAG: alpha-amylase family glycosyl hydrolase [Ignavibacteriaceae bacterium]